MKEMGKIKRATFALLTLALCLSARSAMAQDTVSYADLVKLQTAQTDSHIYWCRNCQQTNPCAAGGSGAFAFGYNETWQCAAPANGPAGPGGTNGQFQYNNSGVLGGFTASGDCTVDTSTGVFTCPSKPGGTNGQLQYNNNGAFGAFTASGACTVNVSTGVFTCPSKSGLLGSSNAVVDNAVANFFPASGTDAPVASTLEGDVSTAAPWVATVKNLKCVLTSAAGVVTVAGGTNYVVALRKNIATSTLTCTIAAAASACADTSHTVTTAIGDQLDFIITPTGTPTALVAKCSAEVDI